MNFSKHFIFVAAAVLVVFARQSDAGFINAISAFSSAVESGLSAFIQSIETSIAEGKKHSSYYKAKQSLEQQASKASNKKANSVILNGMNDAIASLEQSVDAVYDCLNEAIHSVNISSEVTVQKLGTCMVLPNACIVNAGAKMYNALGAATEMSEDGARPGLNKAVQIATTGGMMAFSAWSAIQNMASRGIAARKDARDQALYAAVKSVHSTEKAALDIILRTAQEAFNAVDNENLPADVDPKAILARQRAAVERPECRKAIRELTESANDASGKVTSAVKQRAIKIVRDAFIYLLEIIARAAIISYDAIDDAKNIENKELALATITKGIDKSKIEYLYGVAIGQQNLGALTKIIGSEIEMGVIQAMIIIETSRVDIMDGLDDALLIISNGIKNNVPETAYEAGAEGVKAAGFAGYDRVLKSAYSAFNTIILAPEA